ncbi:MAG: AMP-binding protein [Thermoanaerobaculia bacterium]|nr:AMP-binding protein [Thermoanaerobaculia bacterium]
MTICSLLERRSRAAPDALAFTFGANSLTYRELRDDAGRIAAALRHQGVAAGDRVPIVLPAGLDIVRIFYALQRLGAIPSILDPHVPATAIARRVAMLRPRLVLTSMPDLARPAPLPPIPDDEGAIAFLQLTSGTSAEARAAIVLQRNVMASLESARAMVEPVAGDILVGWVPPWHDLGLLRFVIAPLFFGLPCHLVEPAVRTIPLWLATIARVRGTITGVPDFAWRLATRLVDPKAADLSSLRFATNGGEPVRASTIDAFEERFGLHNVIRPGYGLAEATLGVSSLRPGESQRVDARGNVSCGRPLDNVEVRIDGEAPGEILVRGNAVFAGYFDEPAATAETLRDGWLHTGDTGYLDGDGHLYVLGRERAMIKRGGAALAPRELEEAAQSVPGVRVAAAIGVPRELTEEIVVVVETDPDAKEVERLVMAAVERALGFAPHRVIVAKPRTIPRTSNGKIRHAELRRQLT